MVRVTVKKAISVCPNGQFLEFKAGETVEGPVAIWLIDQSGCEITIEQDDRPALAAEVDRTADPDTAGGSDGALTAALTASADLANDTAAKGAKTAK